jgi:hypothetical protein
MSIMRKLLLIALAAVTTTLIGDAVSFADDPASVQRYFCDFNRVASPKGLKTGESFKLEYVHDTNLGKGMLIGNLGFSEVFVAEGVEAITFVEMLVTGVVQTTSVTRAGNAVHSRHTTMPGARLTPSQWYGKCRIVEGERPIE